MRILHLIPSMGGGGAERQLCYIAKQMVKDGIDLHVAYFQTGINDERLKSSGAKIYKLSSLNNYDPIILLKIINLIKKINPLLIQTWIPQMDVITGLSAIFRNKPFILSERASALAYGSGWKDKLRVSIGKKSVAILANSEEGLKYWKDKTKKPHLKVIRNGIPFDEINAIDKIDLPSEYKEYSEIIIYAGRYDKQKNLFNLIYALEKVLEKRKSAIAILFGKGPQKDLLIETKNKFSVRNRIIIMDYSINFWGWLKVADVFVSVSEFEGTPNTVLEAVASKCPVVVSDIPEHREILDNNSANFVKLNDIKSIADGIQEVLNNTEESKFKVENAFKKIRHLSVNSITDEYIRFYKFLCERR